MRQNEIGWPEPDGSASWSPARKRAQASEAVERPRRDRRRLVYCLAGALGLHVLTALWRAPASALAPARANSVAAGSEVSVSLDESSAATGSPPGGGSETPAPERARSAPEQSVQPKQPAQRVARAEVVTERRPPSEPVSEPVDDPESGPELLAAVNGDGPLAPRPRAARKTLLESHASASALQAERQEHSLGRSVGSGFGVNGGPGGNGRGDGSGIVGERFAFGGPSGSFRADVCFIEPTVKSLRDIKHCGAALTFFTDVLNVPPRRFNQGFPGITERTEWFAIKYRGRFKVTASDVYTFKLISDDGATLSIDGYPIIDNDGQHEPRPRDATITLEAGEHEFFVFYYQGPADLIALQLFVRRFQGAEQLFGPVI